MDEAPLFWLGEGEPAPSPPRLGAKSPLVDGADGDEPAPSPRPGASPPVTCEET